MTESLICDHPYYCAEGNFHKSGLHTEWPSWAAFLREFKDADLDYNHVWRWDWPPSEDDLPADRLKIYMVAQRKAIYESHEIKVKPEDEPSIRAFLEKHAARTAEMWAPIPLDTRAPRWMELVQALDGYIDFLWKLAPEVLTDEQEEEAADVKDRIRTAARALEETDPGLVVPGGSRWKPEAGS